MNLPRISEPEFNCPILLLITLKLGGALKSSHSEVKKSDKKASEAAPNFGRESLASEEDSADDETMRRPEALRRLLAGRDLTSAGFWNPKVVFEASDAVKANKGSFMTFMQRFAFDMEVHFRDKGVKCSW